MLDSIRFYMLGIKVLLAAIAVSMIVLFVAMENEENDNALSWYKDKSTYSTFRFEKLPALSQEINGSGIISSGGKFKNNFGGDVELEVYCTLRKFGFNRISAAAVMGNIQAESNFKPDMIEQKATEPKGYGLFQLTNHKTANAGRSTDMRNYVAKSGARYPSVESQMEFFEYETKTMKDAFSLYYQANYRNHYLPTNPTLYANLGDKSLKTWDDFKNYKGSVDTATAAFMMGFERPAFKDSINHLTTRRIPKAKEYYEKYLVREKECYTQESTSSLTGNDVRDRIVQIAKQQLGKPYIWGATGPDTFDCSGLVVYSYNKAGYKFTASSRHYTLSFKKEPYYREIDCSNAKPGDLMFTNPSGINHVVIILEAKGGYNVKYIHAPQKNDIVKIQEGTPPAVSYRKCATFFSK